MPAFMRNINIISRCGAIWRGDKLKDTDIGAAHTALILSVCRHPGISQDRLSKTIYINKSNVTRNLAYLERCGYVERRQNEEDKRVTNVYPTDKAREMLPKIKETSREWNAYLTEDISEEEMELFVITLSRLAKRAAEYAQLSLELGSEDEVQ